MPPGPWCCAVFITLWIERVGTPRMDSERVSWCISPMINCATSGWRFWTMANPSAQLAQYSAVCVLDALCRPRPPREIGSDTVLCVNSGTADACTPRIVVGHFQIAASCETQIQNWHERRRNKTTTMLPASQEWRGCDPEARHGQCVVPSTMTTFTIGALVAHHLG